MVVKIFDQGKDEMTNEIKTLTRLRKIQKKKYADEGKGLIPRQYYFGSLIVTDEGFQKQLYFYSVMERYNQTLEQ